jgi:hypothetical protein
MAQLQSAINPSVAPTQVWASLSTDLQSHALRLLAQLACTCAAMRAEPPSQEVAHVNPAVANQDPPRTS